MALSGKYGNPNFGFQRYFLFQKSVGIWLSLWAIRYKADWDYKLSGTAKGVRWGVVGIGYTLAALPGPALLRLLPGVVGICFLCWPNLGYHLTNFFVDWPITEGRVESSSALDSSHSVVSYSFELGHDTFGGSATVKSQDVLPYSEGERVTVAYDPLNPDQSKILPQISAQPQ